MKTAIVVTTINQPTEAMIALRDGAGLQDRSMVVIGDSKSESHFGLEGASFSRSMTSERLDFDLPRIAPQSIMPGKTSGIFWQ